MFEDKKPRYYIKSKEGKMLVSHPKDASGKVKITTHDYFSGVLVGIEERESVWKEQTLYSYQLEFIDENVDESYILQVSRNGVFARGLFNCLAALPNPEHVVKIGCYYKNEFNLPSVYQGGHVVKWKYENPPKAKMKDAAGNEFSNDRECFEFVSKCVEEVKEVIKGNRLRMAAKHENLNQVDVGQTQSIPQEPDLADEDLPQYTQDELDALPF